MKNLKVVQLRIENLLNIKAIEIIPKDNFIMITGRNGQGKSNTIDSIWIAIGGKREEPKKPIRKGQADASVFVDLGEIIVRRRFTEKGSYLDVKNKDGLQFTSPQAILDSLFTTISIDPSRFCLIDNRQRRELLLELTGKKDELEGIEEKKKSIFAERTVVNRDVKTLEGKLSGMPEYGDIQEKSISDLMMKLKESENNDHQLQEYIDELKLMIDDHLGMENLIQDKRDQINALKKEIGELQIRLKDNESQQEYSEKLIEKFPASKTDKIREEIESAEEHNSKARLMKQVNEFKTELEKKKKISKIMTGNINDLDKKKSDILIQSKIPVKNLTITEDELLIDDIPFDDLSKSEQMKIAINIAISQNPKLRVLRMEGSYLDHDSMEEIKAFAQEKDIQIWAEVVSENPQEGFFIKEGGLVKA